MRTLLPRKARNRKRVMIIRGSYGCLVLLDVRREKKTMKKLHKIPLNWKFLPFGQLESRRRGRERRREKGRRAREREFK